MSKIFNMNQSVKIQYLRFLTPFINEEEDPKYYRFCNNFINFLFVVGFIAAELVVITFQSSLFKILTYSAFVLFVFFGVGVFIMIIHPIIKKRTGRPRCVEIPQKGHPFKDKKTLASFERMLNDYHNKMNSSDGYALANALKSAKLLNDNYAVGDLSLWIYDHYTSHYKCEYATKSLTNQKSKSDIHKNFWTKQITSFFQ